MIQAFSILPGHRNPVSPLLSKPLLTLPVLCAPSQDTTTRIDTLTTTSLLLILISGSSSTVGTARTLHGERARGGRVEDSQLVRREEARHDERAHGDQREDEDGEADGGDGLRDGEGGAEADELGGHEGPQRAAPPDAAERVVRGREVLVAEEVQQLLRDAVGLEGLVSHYEEQAGEHGLRDEVEDNEQWAGCRAEGQEALREVRYPLLDDVGALVGVVALGFWVVLVRVDFYYRDAERFRVERRLRNQAVGEG